VANFGAGMFASPHGLYADRDGNIWATDFQAKSGKGHTVTKFSPDGKVLMVLGKPGVAGNDQQTFHEPSAVLVAPNGNIFVADGHTQDKGNARIVKLDPHGKFLAQWGEHGSKPGQMDIPHCLAMDSQGRLFVGDRGNNRMDIFDQNGKFIASWSQFGRPSGCYIDSHDMLYVADSESHLGHHPGWMRGVRIGSVKDGLMTAFIPDDPDVNPEKMGTSNGEGVWADKEGVIYDAEVGQKAVVRYAPKSSG
jgi:sugar lactone lactonase YvrE